MHPSRLTTDGAPPGHADATGPRSDALRAAAAHLVVAAYQRIQPTSRADSGEHASLTELLRRYRSEACVRAGLSPDPHTAVRAERYAYAALLIATAVRPEDLVTYLDAVTVDQQRALLNHARSLLTH
ncbi:hypothetical protein [Actinospica robiniae]|uniref:hypothetical protein n=1 Tax=Actinospica robiniae TaxID=304901 RepID=UPI0003FD6C4F|nr:hypothetical protein [Actinospica robiniae]